MCVFVKIWDIAMYPDGHNGTIELIHKQKVTKVYSNRGLVCMNAEPEKSYNLMPNTILNNNLTGGSLGGLETKIEN